MYAQKLYLNNRNMQMNIEAAESGVELVRLFPGSNSDIINNLITPVAERGRDTGAGPADASVCVRVFRRPRATLLDVIKGGPGTGSVAK